MVAQGGLLLVGDAVAPRRLRRLTGSLRVQEHEAVDRRRRRRQNRGLCRPLCLRGVVLVRNGVCVLWGRLDRVRVPGRRDLPRHGPPGPGSVAAELKGASNKKLMD